MIAAIQLVLEFGPDVIKDAVALYQAYEKGLAAYKAKQTAGGTTVQSFEAAFAVAFPAVAKVIAGFIAKDLGMPIPPGIQKVLDVIDHEIATLTGTAPAPTGSAS